MPDYGKADYWDNRYATEDTPFDWLFSFDDVREIISTLLPDRDANILLVGCGNALFSPDMYFQGGFKNIRNTDLSSVVIEQQKLKYPEISWEVMDVLNMPIEDNSVPAIIDKSLIDTLLCYTNSNTRTTSMIDEIYRVLAPGGRFITFSLHSEDEVIRYFTEGKYEWVTSSYRVKSTRWNENETRRRAVAHTMIVCDKADVDGTYNRTYPLHVEGTLSDGEYQKLVDYAAYVNEREAFKKATMDDLFHTLDKALVECSSAATEVKQQPRRQKTFKDVIEGLQKDVDGHDSPRGVNQES